MGGQDAPLDEALPPTAPFGWSRLILSEDLRRKSFAELRCFHRPIHRLSRPRVKMPPVVAWFVICLSVLANITTPFHPGVATVDVSRMAACPDWNSAEVMIPKATASRVMEPPRNWTA